MRCHGATVAAALSAKLGSSSRPEWEAVQWGLNDESLAISATVYRHLSEANDDLKRRAVFVNRPAQRLSNHVLKSTRAVSSVTGTTCGTSLSEHAVWKVAADGDLGVPSAPRAYGVRP